MKFITNKISTSKSTGFSDFVKKLAESNAGLAKTASTEVSTKKEANSANFGGKQAPPFGKKDEEPKKDDADADGEKKDEKDGCCASTEKEVKVAKDSKKVDKDGVMHVKKQEMDPVGGTNTGKPEGEKKKEANAKASKKASNSDVDPANKGVTHKVDECCGAPTSKGDDGSEGEKSKSSSKSEPKAEEKKEEKEASARKFVRIANLDSKTKNEWKKYWGNLYPKEYVDAMFADK